MRFLQGVIGRVWLESGKRGKKSHLQLCTAQWAFDDAVMMQDGYVNRVPMDHNASVSS